MEDRQINGQHLGNLMPKFWLTDRVLDPTTKGNSKEAAQFCKWRSLLKAVFCWKNTIWDDAGKEKSVALDAEASTVRSTVVATPQPHNTVVATPQPHNTVVATPQPHDTVVATPQPHNTVVATPQPHNTVVATPQTHNTVVATPQPR